MDKAVPDISFENNWLVKNNSYNKETEYLIETLLAQGNGYIISRASLEESDATRVNYPGNYIVGLYNKALHVLGEKKIERDEIINLPNWWQINFKIENNSFFDINHTEIIEFERILNLKNGILTKKMIVKDKIGHLTQINSERIINFNNPNIIAQTYSIIPLNYSGKIKLHTRVNGNVYNERDMKAKHIYISDTEGINNNLFILAETLKSNKSVLIINHIDYFIDNEKQKQLFNCFEKEREIYGEIEISVKEKQNIRIEKKGYIKCFDSLINPKQERHEALNILKAYKTYDNIIKENEIKWDELWKEIGIEIISEQTVQPYLNFYLYHLLITYSQNTEKNTSGFPSYSIQGEKNHGLSSWEELFIVPFINLHFPEVSYKILEYRNKRLSKAIENATTYKLNGALFPWKSGIEGNEQSYRERFNPVTKIWQEDLGYLQRHINLSVAYNIIHYYKTTGNKEYFYETGIKILIEICRFWASSVEFDRDKNRYDLKGIIGPDEFHTKYKDTYSYGIDNNTYTNFMIVWLLINTIQFEKQLPDDVREKLKNQLKLKETELEKWKDISMFMKIEISDDEIIEQYSEFFKLAEIDWNEYRKNFSDLHNIDKILTAEGKSTNDFQIIKQADTLLPFYFLSPEEIRNIMLETGYLLEKNFLDINFNYYYKRTSHSSLLSKPVHALIAHHNNDRSLCYKLFNEALTEVENFNYEDIRDNGINMGVAGAIMNIIYTAFAGVSFKENHIIFSPNLPSGWKQIKFNLRYRGAIVMFNISKDESIIDCIENGDEELYIDNQDKEHKLKKGEPLKI